jgi:hypothetical protein
MFKSIDLKPDPITKIVDSEPNPVIEPVGTGDPKPGESIQVELRSSKAKSEIQFVILDDNDSIVRLDRETKDSQIYSIDELKQGHSALAQKMLDEVPPPPEDKILLEWALANYPMQGEYNQQRERYQRIIDEANALLEEVK